MGGRSKVGFGGLGEWLMGMGVLIASDIFENRKT